jgi:PLAC8 family
MQRSNTRAKYGIEGNACEDWLAACCCPCCALVQEDKEAFVRQTGTDPKTGQQYVAPAGMTYG